MHGTATVQGDTPIGALGNHAALTASGHCRSTAMAWHLDQVAGGLLLLLVLLFVALPGFAARILHRLRPTSVVWLVNTPRLPTTLSPA